MLDQVVLITARVSDLPWAITGLNQDAGLNQSCNYTRYYRSYIQQMCHAFATWSLCALLLNLLTRIKKKFCNYLVYFRKTTVGLNTLLNIHWNQFTLKKIDWNKWSDIQTALHTFHSSPVKLCQRKSLFHIICICNYNRYTDRGPGVPLCNGAFQCT